MPTLLEIESSPMNRGASVSRDLTARFVQQWKQAHPDGTVISRDLNTSRLPIIDAEWITASQTPEEQRTPAQRDALTLSDTLIAELEVADEYVFGVPMHNFTVPSVLRLWIDKVARAGKTFRYVNGAPEGLLKGKKAHFIIASGGKYTAGTPMASYDFVEPYLRTMFGFLGVTDVTFVAAGGTAALSSGKVDRPSFLAPHVHVIETLVQAA
jgi:FMN-dependent NADH-azoreductase